MLKKINLFSLLWLFLHNHVWTSFSLGLAGSQSALPLYYTLFLLLIGLFKIFLGAGFAVDEMLVLGACGFLCLPIVI